MPETLEVVPAQYQENFKAHTNLERQARELAAAVKDDASYRALCDFRIMIDKQRKNWALVIKPAVSAAHDAHKKIKKVETDVDGPLANALLIADPVISNWRREQENLRAIEQEKINRKFRQDEEDRRLKEAEELAKSGDHAEADRVMEAPIQAPQVVLPSSTKVAGIQDRTYWSAEVFDIQLLCKAVVDGKVDAAEVLTANLPALNAKARTMKAAMNAQWEKYGVRAVSRQDIAGGCR
jgi:hypothetical protein